MKLDWHDVTIDAGKPAISTSLTLAESEALARLADKRRVLEVGTAYGYSTVILAGSARDVVAVDPHHWLRSQSRLRANLDAYDVADKVDVRVDHIEDVAPVLLAERRKFGLIFIDANHEEWAVRRDIDVCRPLLARSGVLALHDYGEDTCPGVRTALDDVLGEPHELVDTLAIYRGLGSA